MKVTLIIGMLTFVIFGVAVAAPADYPVMGDGFYDHTNPLITYTGGGWLAFEDPSSYGGSMIYTDGTGDSVQFEFYSDGFTLYGAACGSSCSSNVTLCIDSIPCSTFSTFVFSEEPIILYNTPYLEITGLSTGVHSVEVISNGSGQRFHFTALHIHPVEHIQPEATQEIVVNVTIPAPEITVEPFATPSWQVGHEVADSSGSTQETVYEYKVTTGDQQIVTWLIVISISLVALIVLLIWQGRS